MMSFCTNCGSPVNRGARFCTNCGDLIFPLMDQTDALPGLGPEMVKTGRILALILTALGAFLQILSPFLNWINEGFGIELSLFQAMRGAEMLELESGEVTAFIVFLFLISLLSLVCALLPNRALWAAQCFADALILGGLWIAVQRSMASLAFGPGFTVLGVGALLMLLASAAALFAEKRLACDVGLGLLWAGGPMAAAIISGTLGGYALFFAGNILRIDVGRTGTVIQFVSILTPLVGLLMGPLVDCTRSPLGKARYLDLALMGSAGLAAVLFLLPAGGESEGKLLPFALLYGGAMVLSALAQVGNGAYLYHALPRNGGYAPQIAVGISALFGMTVGFLLNLWLSSRLFVNGFESRKLVPFLLIAAVLVLPRLLAIPEKPWYLRWDEGLGRARLGAVLKGVFSGGSALLLLAALFCLSLSATLRTSLGVYFWVEVMGKTGGVSLSGAMNLLSILAFIFFVPLAGKRHRDLMLILNLMLALVGNILMITGGRDITTLILGMGLNAIGYAPLLSMTALFLLELAEDKAEYLHVHVPGTLFALAGVVTTLSSMAASMLVNLILVNNGYVGGELVQPAQAISGIEGLYTWGAALPFLLALVLVLLLPAVREREKRFWRM